MAHTPDLPHFFEENINLEGLFDILSPKNNLVLADDMMLSDADGIILRVSENYERNFGFTHDSIVGKSAFDLEARAGTAGRHERRERRASGRTLHAAVRKAKGAKEGAQSIQSPRRGAPHP